MVQPATSFLFFFAKCGEELTTAFSRITTFSLQRYASNINFFNLDGFCLNIRFLPGTALSQLESKVLAANTFSTSERDEYYSIYIIDPLSCSPSLPKLLVVLEI